MTASTTRVAATTHTLEVPGATLTYDVRRNDATTEPPLVLIGTPMGASGFETLAGFFSDRTVVTYDPRGTERSTISDASIAASPEEHGEDVHRLIEAIGGGPVDLFASSGAAVTSLALVASHPDDVRTLVAHEPPNFAFLPDRKEALAVVQDIQKTYEQGGLWPAMAKFMGAVSHQGPFPADFVDRPAPDPATFGMPTEDDGSRDDAMMRDFIVKGPAYEPNIEALRAAPTRIVMAVGAESEGILARRGGEAIAERLGSRAVVFPSGHPGFMGGEYGQTGEPEAFATKLREILAGA
jgi:pimeloyl-ACP methyl ester carboxylesterase